MLKLLSLFFALFLWYFVVGEDKVDMNVTIPVEIVNLPRDLVISNQFKKQLEVTMSGQRSLIRGLAEQHISRSIDLSNASPGTVVIQNQPDSIKLPRGLSILRIQPPTLTLLLDRLIQKKLPIKPVVVGKVHKDYLLDSVVSDPPTLEISGPQTILGQHDALKTSQVNISGLTQSAVRQVSLDLQPEMADLIGEPVVAVRVNVIDLKKQVTIPDIPVQFDLENGRQTETIYRLKPPAVTVTAEIPQVRIEKSEDLRSLFGARVSPQALTPGSHTLKVNVTPPPQTRIIAVSPESVTLEIDETRKLKVRK